MPVIKPQT